MIKKKYLKKISKSTVEIGSKKKIYINKIKKIK